MSRFLILATLALVPVFQAHAQALKYVPLVGVHLDSPTRFSAAIGVGKLFHRQVAERSREGVVFIAVEPGLGGGRFSAGVLSLADAEDTNFRTIRVTVLRTWKSPLFAPPNVTYAGAEVQWNLFIVGFRAGLLARVSKATTGKRILPTVSYAFLF